MLERRFELPELAIGEPELVLQVGVVRVAQRGGGERLDRGVPVACLDGFPAGSIVGVERTHAGLLFGVDGVQDRRDSRGEHQQQQMQYARH